MTQPVVSVIMPVLNEEKYLAAAIESVLNQTFKDFELLIISENDTSRESLRIISRYRDDRIRHIHNSKRLGLIRSLNAAITRAKGHYIARFDADDINLPHRFEKQLNFLNRYSDVGVVGARYDIIDSAGRVIWRPRPTLARGLIKWRLLFGDCAVAHPSVMVRSEVYNQLGGYSATALYVEDYELWTRAVEITEVANMPDTLVLLRAHAASVSHAHESEQLQRTLSISRDKLSRMFQEEVPSLYLDAIMLHRLRNGKDALAAASWMHSRCFDFLGKQHMPTEDEKSIRAFTARKLYPLALMCLTKWPRYSVRISQLVFELDPVGSTQLWLDFMGRAAKYPIKFIHRSLTRIQPANTT